MRVTTGLLLTVALLIPGAARAQIGIPGAYDPLESRPGLSGTPGVSVGPPTPYIPGLPPQVNEMLRNQGSPGTPFGPGGFRQPGLSFMPGGVREPYIPGVSPIDDPLGRQLECVSRPAPSSPTTRPPDSETRAATYPRLRPSPTSGICRRSR